MQLKRSCYSQLERILLPLLTPCNHPGTPCGSKAWYNCALVENQDYVVPTLSQTIGLPMPFTEGWTRMHWMQQNSTLPLQFANARPDVRPPLWQPLLLSYLGQGARSR